MSISHLHDDLLLHLAKYLHPRDHLALALSGENERFSVLYGTNREKLVLSECYFLSNKPWRRFFKDFITPSSIIVCDVSHCYWLKAKVLLRCIIKMPNLEELYIQDTRMSLKKMPQVFEACQKIAKLSLTLKEANLDEFQKGVTEKSSLKWMKRGFRKITHLKLFLFIVPSPSKCDPKVWEVALGLLIWCRDCIDLLISNTYLEDPCTPCEDDDTQKNWLELLEEYLPQFGWMAGLKNLVILNQPYNVRHEFTLVFILDLLWQIQGDSLDSLERLWVDYDYNINVYKGLEREMSGPVVKSLYIQNFDWPGNFVLYEDRFCHFEHLADTDEFDGLEHLPHLKYISGDCRDLESLNRFFQTHEKLEELHVRLSDNGACEEDEVMDHYPFGIGDGIMWKLNKLKILRFRWSTPLSLGGVMDHFVKCSPAIDQLHIEFQYSYSKTEMIALFSNTIRFNHLTWLNINVQTLFDGSYLSSIVENCPKMEKLHLKGRFKAKTFFLHLAKCFPSARNLRDLRVQWPSLQKDLSHFPFFLRALKLCTHFERLVLCADADKWSRKPSYYAPLQDSILLFAQQMPHLVALCLTGFPIDHTVVEQQLIAQMAPEKENRPAFWFHLGPELPKVSDLSVPRVHFDGIVNPYKPLPRF